MGRGRTLGGAVRIDAKLAGRLSWSMVEAQGEHGRIKSLACVTSFTDGLLITSIHTAFGNQLAGGLRP